MHTYSPFAVHPDCIYDRQKLRGALLDLLPGDALAINLVMAAYDSGIVSKIHRAAGCIDSSLLRDMRVTLMEQFGIRDECASWAVDYWVENYAVAVLGKVSEAGGVANAPVPKVTAFEVSGFPSSQGSGAVPVQRASASQWVGAIAISSMEEGEKTFQG